MWNGNGLLPPSLAELRRTRSSLSFLVVTVVQDTAPRSRRAFRASSERKRAAPDSQRAQGKPGARCTRGLACKRQKQSAHEHTGSAEAVRPSLRSGLRLIARSPRRSGFLVTVAGGKFSRQLDASVEASGPHDFAVRIRAVRQGHFHVHRIPHPTSVTTAKRPSCGHETAIHWTDLAFLKIRIFFREGLDRGGDQSPR